MLHRTTLTLALLSASTLAACGGEEKDVSKYVGNWTYMTGSVTVNCDKAPPMQFPLTGSFKVASGTDSDLATSPDMTTCNLKFDVSGTTVSMRPNQFCMFPAMGMAPPYSAALSGIGFHGGRLICGSA